MRWRATHMHAATATYVRVTGIEGDTVRYDGLAGQTKECELASFMRRFTDLATMPGFAEQMQLKAVERYGLLVEDEQERAPKRRGRKKP